MLGRIAVALLVPLLVIWPAGSAWAHHPLIRARVSCGGVVSFVVEAWASHNPKARENPAIEVAYATGGGTFQSLPQKRSYAFAVASGFRFSDTFRLPRPLPVSITLRARSIARWGDGASGGHDAHLTAALPVPRCPSTSPAPRSSQAAHSAGSSLPASPGAASATGDSRRTRGAAAVTGRGATTTDRPAGLLWVASVVAVALLAAGGWALARVRRG